MSIGNRIMELRKERGFTRKEFAEYLGIPSNTLRNYELGVREPGHPFIVNLAYALNVSTDYLLCLTDDRSPVYINSDLAIFNEEELETIKKYHKLDIYGKRAVDQLINTEYERTMDQLSHLEEAPEPYLYTKTEYLTGLSAGTGLFVFDDIPTQVIDVPEKYKDADFVIGVSGDSMMPTYCNGDKVAVKKCPRINKGEIGVFMVNGNGYIKELGEDKLISHNKSFADININDTTICIGKVLGRL